MSLSQKILESTEVEERENIINNLKDRIKRLEVDMAHMLKRDFEYANRKRNEPVH